MGVDVQRRRTHFRGKSTGVREDIQIYPTEAAITLAEADSGKTIIATLNATQTFTLPSAAKAGLKYTFVTGHVDGDVTIAMNGNDTVTCKAEDAAEPTVAVATSAGDGIINTGGTNVVGDRITLISDGVSKWYAVAQSGIWASV